MRRTSFSDMRCSVARALEVVGEWWTPLILRDVWLGVRRFDDIAEDLGISRNLLAGRLDGLVAAGIVERRPYQEHPPRHEYHLTEAGLDLIPILMALTAWGDRHATHPDGPPVRFVHDECGAECTAEVTCSSCGRPVSAGTVTVRPGPGGAPAPGTKVLARRLAAG